MPYAQCPKCCEETYIEKAVDGIAVWCPKCGNTFKAHSYRTSSVKGGAKLAEAEMD